MEKIKKHENKEQELTGDTTMTARSMLPHASRPPSPSSLRSSTTEEHRISSWIPSMNASKGSISSSLVLGFAAALALSRWWTGAKRAQQGAARALLVALAARSKRGLIGRWGRPWCGVCGWVWEEISW